MSIRKNRSKPNILFLFTDDQRFDALGASGNKEIHTPNMDDLAAEGTMFSNAHIPGGTCPAICMPSRAMLHTGRTLFHLEDSGNEIPAEHALMAEILKASGYRTFGSGKWHNGRRSFHRSFSEGNEITFCGMADHWNVPVYNYDPSGKYDSFLFGINENEFMHSNKKEKRLCDHIHAGKHSSELIAEAGADYIMNFDGMKPFFMYLSFLAPHDPRTMPEQYLDLYDPEALTLPPNFAGGHPFDIGALHVRDENLAGFPRDPKETLRHIAEYYAMITHLDAQIGLVLEALRSKGLLEDTIIILCGDNGLALGQHGLFGKQNCYEHSVRVPLILRGPYIPEGKLSDAYVYLSDIFPTLCSLLEIEQPESVEGLSLAPVLNGSTKSVRNSMYFAYREYQRAVKKDNFKLIEYVVNERHTNTQLFNLNNDPWETTNLADSSGTAGILETLKTEMTRLRFEWDDCETRWGKTFWKGYDPRG